MADQVRQRTVTATAGTLKAAPLQVDISFPPAAIQKLEIIIPPGHAGLTGLAIAHAHQPIIPFDAGEYIVSDDEKVEWFLEDQPDSGNWQAFVFNTDVFDHVFYIRFLLVVVTRVPVIVNGPTPFVAPASPDDSGEIPYIVTPVGETPPEIEPEPDQPPTDIPDEPPPDDTPAPDDTPSPDDTPDAPDDIPSDDAVSPVEPATPVTPAPAPPSGTHEPAPQAPLPIIENPHVFGYYTTLQAYFPNGEVSQWHHYTSGTRQGDLVQVSVLGNIGKGAHPPSSDGWYKPPHVLKNATYERVLDTSRYE